MPRHWSVLSSLNLHLSHSPKAGQLLSLLGLLGVHHEMMYHWHEGTWPGIGPSQNVLRQQWAVQQLQQRSVQQYQQWSVQERQQWSAQQCQQWSVRTHMWRFFTGSRQAMFSEFQQESAFLSLPCPDAFSSPSQGGDAQPDL